MFNPGWYRSRIVTTSQRCTDVTAPRTSWDLMRTNKYSDADTILAGDSGHGSQKFMDAGGSAVDGMLFPANFVSSASESSIAFSAAYENAYSKAPDLWAATGYTMMQTVANAIRNAGDDVNRETLRVAMAATSGLPVVLGKGTLSFDENRIPSMGGIVMQLRDSKWVKP